jgi:hypothetical protein
MTMSIVAFCFRQLFVDPSRLTTFIVVEEMLLLQMLKPDGLAKIPTNMKGNFKSGTAYQNGKLGHRTADAVARSP